MIYKLYWLFQSFFYSFFFKKFTFPAYIASPIFLYGVKRVEVNKRVRIFPGARIETHDNGRIIFEENVGIAQNFHITASKGKVIIGKNTTIAANSFVTNIDHEYKNIGISILEQATITRETIIGENCFIGFGVAIQAGTILGKQCIVGANSVVRGVFPDYCVIVGSPAKIIKKFNFDSKKWEKYVI